MVNIKYFQKIKSTHIQIGFFGIGKGKNCVKVANKVIIVTGGGNGIGRELVLLLLQKQAKVVVVELSMDKLLETQKLSGVNDERLMLLQIDICDREKVMVLPEQIISHFGQVDGLINNAGIIQPFKVLNDLGIEAAVKVMNVNYYGPLFLIKAFLPYFLQRPEGHFINICSMGGFLPVPGQSVYGASKAALKLLTEGLYAELKGTPVKVTVIFLGSTQTNIAANSGIEIKASASKDEGSFKMLPADEAARQIIEGMEKDKFRVLVGSDSKFMDFLYRLNPHYAVNFIQNKMKGLLKRD